MKVLIGVIATHHPSRASYNESQRERLKGSPIPYKFVYGYAKSNGVEERPPLEDELFFNCDDTRPWMVEKNKELFRYALENGYDYVFRMCDDTILYPDRLLAANLEGFDYGGCICGYGQIADTNQYFWIRFLDYMHGGCGIWLSRKAMEILIADDWAGPDSGPYPKRIEVFDGEFLPGYECYWDDLWIGEVLKGNLNYNDPRRNDLYENYTRMGIAVYDDPQLFATFEGYDPKIVIATHDPKQMGKSELNDIPSYHNMRKTTPSLPPLTPGKFSPTYVRKG